MQVDNVTIKRKRHQCSLPKTAYYSRNTETWNGLKELTTLFKTKIFTAIEILRKEKKKCTDTKSIFEYLNLNLGKITPTHLPCWFSFNNSETIKAVTLAIYSFQYCFIRDLRAQFGIPNLS